MQLFVSIKRLILTLFTFILFNVTGIKINNSANVVRELEKIYLDDQKHRHINLEISVNENEVAFLDRVNLMKIEAIFSKFGYPEFISINEPSHISFFLVIQHAPYQKQLKYLPLIKNAAKNGQMKLSHLAMLEDRIAVNGNKPQIYGSQIGRNDNTGEFYVCPMIDPENVEKRRREMDMPPLKDYVRNWGINL